MAGRSALVLGGGGITGLAWEIGMLAGLREAGVDLTTADVVIGTSAGSIAGAQILSGTPLEELYARQLRDPTGEIASRMGLGTLARFLLVMLLPGDQQKSRARLGRSALRAHTVPAATRRDIIASRLAGDNWPDRDLRITTVDAETGEFVVFQRDSGVSLLDAVCASCAVPLVYPPAEVKGRRYIDGGMRSVANADLATGCDPIVALAPVSVSLRRSQSVEGQIASLGGGIRSIVVKADGLARKAMGTQALDPAFRAAAARAGRTQAASVVRAVAEVWSPVRA
ncbi:MAG TPA: patatin-like phospholipase family protein [Candidatus Dormibacteraeota bacterium]|nr:patatin-like phospholipase family protein [Candidatus Dormibacteraeota bacterium]